MMGRMHTISRNSFCINFPHFFNAHNEAADSCEALPERFDTWLPIAFSGKKSA